MKKIAFLLTLSIHLLACGTHKLTKEKYIKTHKKAFKKVGEIEVQLLESHSEFKDLNTENSIFTKLHLDASGNLLKKIKQTQPSKYSSDGFYITNYVYNTSENLIESTVERYLLGEKERTPNYKDICTYTYDYNQNLTEKRVDSYYKESLLEKRKQVFIYNSKNQLIDASKYMMPTDSLLEKTTFEYHRNSNKIKESFFEKKLNHYKQIEYDSINRITSSKHFDEDGFYKELKYTYKDNQKIAVYYGDNPNNLNTDITKYNEKGQVIEIEKKHTYLHTKANYFYGENGLITKVEIFSLLPDTDLITERRYKISRLKMIKIKTKLKLDAKLLKRISEYTENWVFN